MGSDDTVAVVPSRGATPADQAQQVGGRCRETYTHPLSARQKGANQYARCENSLKCHQRLVTETRLLEGGKVSSREGSEEGGNRPENGRAEEQGHQSAAKTTPPNGTCAHARKYKRPGEQARSRSRISLADVRLSSARKCLRTIPTGRILSTNVDTTDADARGSPAAGDCTDGCHSATRANTVRGDAAKRLARVVRDGSTTTLEGESLGVATLAGRESD